MRKTGLIMLFVAATCGLAQVPPKPALAPPAPKAAPLPPGRLAVVQDRRDEDSVYDRASRMLQKRDYQTALADFHSLVQRGGTRAEGAAYWQAYSLFKLGQGSEALKALAELQRTHPNSRWLNDAKALEMEVRQSQGQNVSPDQQSDEELKLMALASLMSNNSGQALPTLRKVLEGGSSVRVKEQALFVVAQSRTPEARQLLAEYAKGKGNPDLQMSAISMFGMNAGQDNSAVLWDVYKSSSDVAIRRRVLQAFGMSGAGDQLLAAVKGETDQALRVEAIRMLGLNRRSPLSSEAAKAIYQSESSRAGKEALLDALAMRRDGKTLVEIFRLEKDSGLRQSALHRLQSSDPKAAQELMVQILEK